MTDTIAHPPLPEPAAHMLTRDLERFSTSELCAQACSVAYSTPYDGRSEPLYTAQQMREYRDASAWLPIETVDKSLQEVLLRRGSRVGASTWLKWPAHDDQEAGCCWACSGDGDGWDDDKSPTHWMPLPAAPIEQATGEAP